MSVPQETIESLAIVTGVNQEHIEGFINGELMPDYAHSSKLEKAIADLGLDVTLTKHTPVLPEVEHLVKTTYGRPPEGTDIQLTSVSSLEVGDMITFNPTRRLALGKGQHWMVVESVEIGDENAMITFKGKYVLVAPLEQPVRIAR